MTDFDSLTPERIAATLACPPPPARYLDVADVRRVPLNRGQIWWGSQGRMVVSQIEKTTAGLWVSVLRSLYGDVRIISGPDMPSLDPRRYALIPMFPEVEVGQMWRIGDGVYEILGISAPASTGKGAEATMLLRHGPRFEQSDSFIEECCLLSERPHVLAPQLDKGLPFFVIEWLGSTSPIDPLTFPETTTPHVGDVRLLKRGPEGMYRGVVEVMAVVSPVDSSGTHVVLLRERAGAEGRYSMQFNAVDMPLLYRLPPEFRFQPPAEEVTTMLGLPAILAADEPKTEEDKSAPDVFKEGQVWASTSVFTGVGGLAEIRKVVPAEDTPFYFEIEIFSIVGSDLISSSQATLTRDEMLLGWSVYVGTIQRSKTILYVNGKPYRDVIASTLVNEELSVPFRSMIEFSSPPPTPAPPPQPINVTQEVEERMEMGEEVEGPYATPGVSVFDSFDETVTDPDGRVLFARGQRYHFTEEGLKGYRLDGLVTTTDEFEVIGVRECGSMQRLSMGIRFVGDQRLFAEQIEIECGRDRRSVEPNTIAYTE